MSIRNLRSVLVTIGLSGWCAGTCPAAGSDLEVPHIAVFGAAVTEEAPDQIRWSLAVQNRGADIAAVADEHARLAPAVLTFLDGIGVPKADVQTSTFELAENWVYRDDERVQDGYYARTRIRFTQKDLSRYRDLWAGLSQLRGVTIEYATWDASRRIPLQNSTRIDALNAAREKAQALAAAAGMRIGDPLSIQEDRSAADAYAFLSNSTTAVDADEASESANLAPGSVPIRCRVHVTYQLLPRTH